MSTFIFVYTLSRVYIYSCVCVIVCTYMHVLAHARTHVKVVNITCLIFYLIATSTLG